MRLLYSVTANPEAFLGVFSTVFSWQVALKLCFVAKTKSCLCCLGIADCSSTLGRLRGVGRGSSMDIPSHSELGLTVALQLQCCSFTSHRFFLTFS